ncbi:MAG: hypothetical protein Q4B70_16185, partial [Lachnospiraceae bacterium]|nr:hypothetical protein [Lachnospiraceae bacterium]
KVTDLKLDGNFYYYKKKGVFIDTYLGGGHYTNWYYRFNKAKAQKKYAKGKEADYDYNGNGKIDTTYYKYSSTKNTQITKSAFSKGVKSYVGKTSATKVKFRKNTASNRKKYIK